MSHFDFPILNFGIFRLARFSEKIAKLTIFWHFNQLLSTRNVNVARFARNVEWTFSVIFTHRALYQSTNPFCDIC